MVRQPFVVLFWSGRARPNGRLDAPWSANSTARVGGGAAFGSPGAQRDATGAQTVSRIRRNLNHEKSRPTSGPSLNTPAATYSPGGLRPKYHQRWRA